MMVATITVPSAPSTPWLRELFVELYEGVAHEVSVTLGVAVCKAGKLSMAETIKQLGITDVEARMAQQRLAGIASKWSAE